MDDYIKRSDILGTTRLLDTDIVRQDKVASWLLDQILYDIEHTPAVDAVPVIRCKDCKYSRELSRELSRALRRNDPYENRYIESCLWCMNISEGVMPDDYCSRARRKENTNGDKNN